MYETITNNVKIMNMLWNTYYEYWIHSIHHGFDVICGLSGHMLLCGGFGEEREIGFSGFFFLSLALRQSSLPHWPCCHGRLTWHCWSFDCLVGLSWKREDRLNETASILMKHNYFPLINHWEINMSLFRQVLPKSSNSDGQCIIPTLRQS